MKDKPELTPKAIRKLRRRVANEQWASEAGFWSRPRSSEQVGHDKPIDRQALKELLGKLDWDASFDYKKERTRKLGE